MKRATKTKSSAGRRRPAWKGILRFGLVSIPVQAFSAKAKDTGEIELHWIHAAAGCHRPIHVQKVCPVHGPVRDRDIVSAYKYGRNQYLPIEPEKLTHLRTRNDKTIQVTAIVEPGAIDCMYFTDKTYYLLPDGQAGIRPYAVFREALEDRSRVGVAEATLFRREHVVVVRPVENLLSMTTLNYADHFQSAAAMSARAPKVRALPRELDMARTLLDQLAAEDFDFRAYKDPYSGELHKLIEAELAGKELPEAEPAEEPVALDFMDALKKSLARVRAQPAPAHRHHRKVS